MSNITEERLAAIIAGIAGIDEMSDRQFMWEGKLRDDAVAALRELQLLRASATALSEEQKLALETGAAVLVTNGWGDGKPTTRRMLKQAALLRAMAERG